MDGWEIREQRTPGVQEISEISQLESFVSGCYLHVYIYICIYIYIYMYIYYLHVKIYSINRWT